MCVLPAGAVLQTSSPTHLQRGPQEPGDCKHPSNLVLSLGPSSVQRGVQLPSLGITGQIISL